MSLFSDICALITAAGAKARVIISKACSKWIVYKLGLKMGK